MIRKFCSSLKLYNQIKLIQIRKFQSISCSILNQQIKSKDNQENNQENNQKDNQENNQENNQKDNQENNQVNNNLIKNQLNNDKLNLDQKKISQLILLDDFKDESIDYQKGAPLSNEMINELANKSPFAFHQLGVEETRNQKVLFFDKKNTNPNYSKAIKVLKYKKSMGLSDDLSFEESSKIINEHLDKIGKGLYYFEKTGCPVYGPNYNTPIWYRCNQNYLPYKFVNAELYEKKLIFDFSYDDFMNNVEKNRLVYQLLICLGLNDKNPQPFSLLFANLDQNSNVHKKLNQFYLNNDKLRPNLTLTNKSYLDLIPKEEIIYLSPHAEESLTEFNPNYHYVIGCFIDISFSKCLSYKKAQAEGVKCYKLPIDEFVKYSKQRHKLLPLPVVHQILLDKKMNFDWKYTLECNLGHKRIDLDVEDVDKFVKKYKDVKKHLY